MAGQYQFSANPFTVVPGNDRLEGLNSLANTVYKVGNDMKEERKAEEAKAKWEEITQGALDAYNTGDPQEMIRYAIAHPELQKAFNLVELANHKSKETLENSFASTYKFLANPTRENLVKSVQDRVQWMKGQGYTEDDLQETLGVLDEFDQDPEQVIKEQQVRLAYADTDRYKNFIDMWKGDSEDTSDVETFKYMTRGMSDEDIAKARKINLGLEPRAVANAQMTMTEQGTAGDVAQTERVLAEGRETGKLIAQWNLKPEVEAKVTNAVKQAELAVQQQGERLSNDKAFNVYQSAMQGLVDSLQGTSTGPFIGWLPAVTSNQQIAEGAVAAMAPVLKQLFRASGEGVFTDRDQALLMDMVPTRKDREPARLAKMENIDRIVRSKLGMPPPITEDDIQATMKANNMTREQVIAELQKRGQ